MSIPWCGVCPNCRREMEAHCQKSFDLKMNGTRADGSTLMSQGGKPIYSAFFQQSSFATHAIANERFAIKIRKDAPLDLVGPLACSGQTGAGAVLNSLKPLAGDAIAVFGIGAVGLSSLMAAKIAGCDPIIAVDIHDRRLALARELGATHTINHTGRNDVVAEIRNITGSGVRHAIETSAHPAVLARGGRGADAGRDLRAARQRAARQRGLARHAVPAERPFGAWRDAGRKPAVRIHPASWSIS